MANNRLLLVCVRCSQSLVLARLQAGMEATWLPSRESPEAIEAWYRTHSACDPDVPGLHVGLNCENSEALWIDRNP